MRHLVQVSCLGIIITTATAVQAQRQRGMGRGLSRALASLNLTPEQQAKVDKLRNEHSNRARPGLSVQRLRQQLHAKVGDASTSTAELTQMHEKLIEARTAVMRHQFELVMKTREILNAEQRKSFASALGKRQRRRGGWQAQGDD